MTIKEAAPMIKHSVTSRQLAEYYGFKIDRGGFIPCPFHNEADPSLKIHQSGWYCYGCNKGGDVIDFVKLYENVGFNQAVVKLNEYFKLDLLKPEKVDLDEFIRKRHDKRLQEAQKLLSKAEELTALSLIDKEWCEAWSAYTDAHSTNALARTAIQWWAMVEAENTMESLDWMREQIMRGEGQHYVARMLNKYYGGEVQAG